MSKMCLLAVATAASVFFSAFADDIYTLGEGESAVLNSAATYTAMRIAGDLTVDGAAITCNDICTTGGSIRVTGKGGTFGNANAGTTKWSVTNNASSAVTTFLSDNGGQLGFGRLDVRADDAALASLPGYDGYLPLVTVSNSTVNIRQIYNYSTATARVDVVGTSSIVRPGGWSSEGVFATGAFLVHLNDGANLTIDFGNQMGTIANVAAPTRFEGQGDVKIRACNGNGYIHGFRAGTVFNQTGKVMFYNDLYTPFACQFAESGIFGPNVTEFSVSSTAVTLFHDLEILFGVTLTMPPKTVIPAQYAVLKGLGGMVLDATGRDVSFEGSMSADPQYDLKLRKIGTGEATVTSTNLTFVTVDAGTMRFVNSDCTVRDLVVSNGAQVVVDACTLRLKGLRAYYRTAVRTVNGGKVVFDFDGAEDGTGYIYNPALEGFVRVTGGDAVCSLAGVTNKFFRYTFTHTQGMDAAPRMRGFYLFGETHVWENYGMADASPVVVNDLDDLTAFPENRIRFYCDSATNVTARVPDSWCNLSTLYYTTELNHNMNNNPDISSPVINRDDPVSWLSIDMHLKNAANPIVGYNLGVNELGYANPYRYADSWIVSVSDDGANWTKLETRTDVVLRRANAKDWYYYYSFDGTRLEDYNKVSKAEFEAIMPEYFRLSGYRRDGLSATAPIQVQIDAGASLDLTAYTEGEQTVDGILLDAATCGGTLKGGALAATGVVTIDMGGSTADVQAFDFTFDGTEDVANLVNWKVAVYGKELPGVTASYDFDNRKIVLSSKVKYYGESGEVDLQGDAGDGNIVAFVADGVSITNVTAITGDGRSFSKFGPGSVALTETSDYTGGTYIDEGIVYAGITNAFGTGTVTLKCGATRPCQVVFDSVDKDATYANDFVIEGDTSATYLAFKFVTAGRRQTWLCGNVTAYGNLYMNDSNSGNAQGYTLVQFHGDVTAPGKLVSYPTDNTTRWIGKVTAGTLSCCTGYPDMGCYYLENSENRIGTIKFCYNTVFGRVANAFGGAAMCFQGDDTETGSRNGMHLDGNDQTVAYLYTEYLRRNTRAIDYDNAGVSTLTITGGTDMAVCSSRIGYAGDGNRYTGCSVTVDAGNDDFTQVFTNSLSVTKGVMRVKNGTLRFAGTSTITNVPAIYVEGGAFELDVISTNACANVTNISVGANAAFKLGAQADTPFDAEGKKLKLSMSSTSKLQLAEGVSMTVNRLDIDGQHECKGVYTGDPDGTTATYLPQIEGKGRLTVLRGGGLMFLLK